MARINFSKVWGKAREESSKGGSFGGDPVPLEVGLYNMQLVGAEIGDFGDERKVMTKWCVVGHEDEAVNGTICTKWDGLDEERIVWVQRELMSLGVDLDDKPVETEEDLQGIYDELIENQVVASVKVKESDDRKWTNMRVRKSVEVETDELVDPKEALKSQGGSSSKKKSKDDEDDEDEKSSAKSSRKKEKEEEEDDENVSIAEGDTIKFKHPKTKKVVQGEIVELDEKAGTATVKVEGEKKAVEIEGDAIIEKVEAEDDDKKEEDGEPAELEAGDMVMVKHNKKQVSGVVKKVKGDKVWVKVKGEDDPIEFDVDDVAADVD